MVESIAEQDYSAYPYASPFQGLREKSFQMIFSAPTSDLSPVGAESCSAMLPAIDNLRRLSIRPLLVRRALLQLRYRNRLYRFRL